MTKLMLSIRRASGLLLSPKVWLLIIKPAIVSVLLWALVGGITWYVWGHDFVAWSSHIQTNWVSDASWLGKVFNWLMQNVLWLLIGLVVVMLTALTAIIMIALFGMSAINQVVAQRYFPQLPASNSFGFWESTRHTLKWTLWFIFLWLLSVPTYLLAGLGALIHMFIMARFNQKVFTMDALANHASREEFLILGDKHQLNLLLLGLLVTALGTLPTLIWVGSFFGIVLLPITAFLSVLTFTGLMTYCGLLYSCYCLEALVDERAIKKEGWIHH